MQETREGFRLIVACVVGFLSFPFFSTLLQCFVSDLKPWRADGTGSSEAEYILLVSLAELGLLVISGALVLEGLKRRRSSPKAAGK
jgi:hypothetical protein